jgi:hypothetical protein
MQKQFQKVAHAEAEHLAESTAHGPGRRRPPDTAPAHNAAVKAAAADRAKRLGFGTKAAAATQAELLAKRSGRARRRPTRPPQR